MTLEEFRAALIAQGVSTHEHFAFRCPACGTIQSATDLIRVGAGKTFDEVQKYLGYSCIGRFTGQRWTKESKGAERGCNWTLGGLFRIHKLEVLTDDGKAHHRFEPAAPVDAQAHERRSASTAVPA